MAKSTGGQVYDLCEKDWELLLKRISESVIKNSVKPMVLKHIPADPGKVEVLLDGVVVPSSGYEVSADGRSIIFKLPVERQSKITVRYSTKGV